MNRFFKRHFNSIVLSLFFLSGFAGLGYEICWIRLSSRISGSTTFAVSSVVALFFIGMALGSRYFGNRSGQYLNPLKVYALLEIGIGLIAAVSPYLLSLFEIPYQWIYPSYYQNIVVISAVRMVLIALVIIPPTFLMGGTLPLLAQFHEASNREKNDGVAFLYALNTLGAAVGCLVVGFLMLPLFGIGKTLLVIGFLSQASGLFILYAMKSGYSRAPSSETVICAEHAGSITHYSDYADRLMLYVIIFGIGFCALSFEILWTRFLALITHNTVYTYTISLAVTLVGIAAGSYLARFKERIGNHVALLGLVQILSALFVVFSLLLPAGIWNLVAASVSPLVILLACAAIMLIPSLLSGLCFPLLIEFIRHADISTGGRIGRAVSTNTVGCVLGSMITGFILLPLLGMHATLILTTFLCLMLGILTTVFLDRRTTVPDKAKLTVTAIAAWIFLFYSSDVRLPENYLSRGRELVDFVEGKNSFISVIKKKGETILEMDLMWQGKKSKGHQIMAAHLPMLLHPDAKDVVVIGIGAGQAPGRFLYYDINELECVDLESRIPEVLKKHFPAEWLSDPRAHVVVEDGINYLRNIDKKYDLISVEVGQVFRPQVSSFYNVEFYRDARKKLNRDGMIAQFLPVGFFNDDQLHAVIKTFISVFPRSTLWYNRFSELILIGSVDSDQAIRQSGVDELRKNELVFNDLSFGYPGSEKHLLNEPEVLAASFLMGPETLAKISAGAPILSDDSPILEYGTARTGYSPSRFKKLFEERHDSPEQIIGFTNPELILERTTMIQHLNISNGFK